MDGMHDLGGRQGFGRVRHSRDAKVFHAPWEKRVNALLALAVRNGLVNMDEYRHAIERMEPRHYLGASYYERSMTGLATLCVEKGLVTRDELDRLAGGRFPLSGESAPGRPNAARRQAFEPGDQVRVKNDFVPGHVRTTYDVRFQSEDLWPTAPTRRSCMSACSRATSNACRERALLCDPGYSTPSFVSLATSSAPTPSQVFSTSVVCSPRSGEGATRGGLP